MFKILEKYLKNQKIKVDFEELKFQFLSHPSYPSLHAITGVLDHFNIENIAAEVPVNVETLLELPNTFIAQVKAGNGVVLSVVRRDKLNYHVFISSKDKNIFSEAEFLNKFTGIIVAIEKPEENPNISKNDKVLKKIVLGSVALLSVILYLLSAPTIYPSIYLLLSFIGIFISILIVNQEQGIHTAIGDAFCSGDSDKKDCNAVLSSKGASIIGDYKLSDLSLLYFSGLTLLVTALLVSKTSNFITPYIISLLALPIVIYTIYYQYFVLKQWCTLCLSIVAVLVGQATIAFLVGVSFREMNVINVLIVTLSFTIVFVIWQYLKPIIIRSITLKKEKIEFVKFKRNYSIFESLLNKSPIINTEIPNLQEIVFGNRNSKLEIVIITNPFCGHCKPVHILIEEILKKYKNSVKINVRFNINTSDEKSDVVKISSRILEIYHTKGEKDCLQAMNAIYGGMPPAEWMSEWGKCNNLKQYISVLEKESNWCNENAINFTPEILINGQSFPKEYKREDLLFFIEELEESCNKNQPCLELH